LNLKSSFQGDRSYELQELGNSYEAHFGPKKVGLRLEIIFYREVSFRKSNSWPGPTRKTARPGRPRTEAISKGKFPLDSPFRKEYFLVIRFHLFPINPAS
jgi:hypothetical protein